MFLVTSPIVIKVPTRGLLAVETMHAIVQWLANLNIKRYATSMFVNKKHRYTVWNSWVVSVTSHISLDVSNTDERKLLKSYIYVKYKQSTLVCRHPANADVRYLRDKL